MAARFLYDRIDRRRVGIEPRISAHHFRVEVLLVAAACDGQTRERPPELSFKNIFVLHWFLPMAAKPGPTHVPIIRFAHFDLGVIQHRKLALALAGAAFCEEQAPVKKR